MCKAYTCACGACRALQDMTYHCSASHVAPCPVRTPVAGPPPDAHYNFVKCWYCGHVGLPVEVTSSQTRSSECNTTRRLNPGPSTPSATSPLQEHQSPIAKWTGLAAFDRGLHNQAQGVPQHQFQSHVTHNLIDPRLLALSPSPDAAGETPPQCHGISSSPAPDECAATPIQNIHRSQPSHPSTPYSQQPYHVSPASASSLLHSTMLPADMVPRLIAMDRRRVQLFDVIDQTQRASQATGRRANTPTAEELDQAWATLRETITGNPASDENNN